MAATDTDPQQPAAPAHRPAKKAQLPRFNSRVVTNYEDYQIKNIEVLRKKFGGTDNSTVRTAVDVLSYLNGLPVDTDPSIYLNNFLILANRNGGPTNGR